VNAERRDVVIVGGGAAGMAAAWQLRDRNVLLLEQNEVLGGRLKSHSRGDYWLNLGGHMFPAEGSLVRGLLNELRVDTIEIPGSKTSLSLKGKVHRAKRIETYPLTLPLSVGERIQLIKAGLKIRWKVRSYIAASRRRANETELQRRDRVSHFEHDRSFRALLGPLTGSVDAIFTTAARRAPGEMDELTAGAGIQLFTANWAAKGGGGPVNLLGGSGRLGEAVRRELGEHVVLGARAVSVEADADGAVVHYDTAAGRSSVSARRVIVATPAPIARTLVHELPADVAESLAAVTYGTFVSMAVLTAESGPMPWDDLYAVLTPDLSFNMIFNHANPLRGTSARASGGSLMCYAGGQPGTDMLDLPDSEIERRFTDDLYRVFPQLDGLITEAVVQKWRHGNCYRKTGSDFAPMRRYNNDPSNVIQFAGDYFADVSGTIEDATRSGIETARTVAEGLGSAQPAPDLDLQG
jgi:protoporphyrinogen oxidase